MKRSLREIIHAAVREASERRALFETLEPPGSRRRRRRSTGKPPDDNLPHPMYRSGRALKLIHAWGGGLKLRPTDVLARDGEGAAHARSALLAAGWARNSGRKRV